MKLGSPAGPANENSFAGGSRRTTFRAAAGPVNEKQVIRNAHRSQDMSWLQSRHELFRLPPRHVLVAATTCLACSQYICCLQPRRVFVASRYALAAAKTYLATAKSDLSRSQDMSWLWPGHVLADAKSGRVDGHDSPLRYAPSKPIADPFHNGRRGL